MIATRFFVISLIYLVVKINCNNGDNNLVHSPLDSGLPNSMVNVNNGDETTETHHTTCKITTERLVANAQATFTRVLTGTCNAKAIDERFEKLENSINKQLDEIKESIVRAISKNLDSMGPNELNFNGKQLFSENNNSPDAIIDNNFENMDNSPLARRYQVKNFNNSIHDISTSDGKRKVYTYYWRVTNIREKLLQWETGRSERSSTFNVGNAGYSMYLKFTPKYFPDGTIFVSVGLTKGIQDPQLVWPFPLQIRIKILDMAMDNEPQDRSSRLWDPATICSAHFWGRPGIFGGSDNPECVGLSLPRHLMTVEKTRSSASFDDSSTFNGIYVWDDCLIVELTVYL